MHSSPAHPSRLAKIGPDAKQDQAANRWVARKLMRPSSLAKRRVARAADALVGRTNERKSKLRRQFLGKCADAVLDQCSKMSFRFLKPSDRSPSLPLPRLIEMPLFLDDGLHVLIDSACQLQMDGFLAPPVGMDPAKPSALLSLKQRRRGGNPGRDYLDEA
ncbi:uncharacterized protein VTP21DRAFT_11220 [Calcarisporiella thermophila]|uniref:uncharacterized protein n=1 Tax=Calcarisporiella thermophila TaxID=911321 RepID=UPI00374215F1